MPWPKELNGMVSMITGYKIQGVNVDMIVLMIYYDINERVKRC